MQQTTSDSPYLRSARARTGSTIAGILLAAVMSAACSAENITRPEALTLTGEWTAAKDPASNHYQPVDTFRFSLVQTDTLIHGTWEATGPEGHVVLPGQLVEGRVRDGRIELLLWVDRYAHGCTGPLHQCYPYHDRLIAEFVSSTEVRGRILPQAHPTIPDSELPVLAELTLRR